jgi:hypothetical protein
MDISNGSDKRSLLLELENYKKIFQEKSDLLEKDRLLSEHILHKIWMIENRVIEMNMAERIEDETKYHHELGEATRILDALKQLIQEVLGGDDFNFDKGLPA